MKIKIYEVEDFTKEINRFIKKGTLNHEDYLAFKNELKISPSIGDIIPGTSGIRKVRLKSTNKGKSGGFRVCYYYFLHESIYLLWIYPKNAQENLTQEEKQSLRKIAQELKENHE